MRVITGSARGRRLRTLEGMNVRPTTDKVKEAMFSAIQFQLPGAQVLDLFAGSGQLGIEALSRGAAHGVFVDQSSRSIAVVRENLETTGFTDVSAVVLKSQMDFLRTTDQRFDIAFLDPPYGKGILEETLPVLSEYMNPGGIVICEMETELNLPEKIGHLDLKKTYKYGKIKVVMYSVNNS